LKKEETGRETERGRQERGTKAYRNEGKRKRREEGKKEI